MRVLVTGGSGMVGKHLMYHCASLETSEEFVFLSSKDCDLRNKSDVEKLFVDTNYDAIIHLAARVGGLYDNMAHNVAMFNDNMTMNMNIMSAAFEHGVKRGIFCLSSCVFPAEADLPMTETQLHSGKPHSSNRGYAYAKRMIEVMADIYNENGAEYICVSPVNLYGAFDNFNIEQAHVIPGLMHKMMLAKQSGEQVVVWGTGVAQRQFIHAGDLARAIVCLIYDEKVKDGIFNICRETEDENGITRPEEHTIKDIVSILGNFMELPEDRITYDATRSDGILRKTVTAKKFYEHYPHFQFMKLEDGLLHTVRWFNANHESARK